MFCLTCFHKWHYQQDCVHYQCVSCLCWQLGHKALACPLNYQPTSHPPLHQSPCIQKKNPSLLSSSNHSNPTRPKMVKKPKQGDFSQPIPIPPPGDSKKSESWVNLLIVTRPTLDSREGLTRIMQKQIIHVVVLEGTLSTQWCQTKNVLWLPPSNRWRQ